MSHFLRKACVFILVVCVQNVVFIYAFCAHITVSLHIHTTPNKPDILGK